MEPALFWVNFTGGGGFALETKRDLVTEEIEGR